MKDKNSPQKTMFEADHRIVVLAIDGVGGSGKSTLIKILTSALGKLNIPFKVLKFPKDKEELKRQISNGIYPNKIAKSMIKEQIAEIENSVKEMQDFLENNSAQATNRIRKETQELVSALAPDVRADDVEKLSEILEGNATSELPVAYIILDRWALSTTVCQLLTDDKYNIRMPNKFFPWEDTLHVDTPSFRMFDLFIDRMRRFAIDQYKEKGCQLIFHPLTLSPVSEAFFFNRFSNIWNRENHSNSSYSSKFSFDRWIFPLTNENVQNSFIFIEEFCKNRLWIRNPDFNRLDLENLNTTHFNTLDEPSSRNLFAHISISTSLISMFRDKQNWPFTERYYLDSRESGYIQEHKDIEILGPSWQDRAFFTAHLIRNAKKKFVENLDYTSMTMFFMAKYYHESSRGNYWHIPALNLPNIISPIAIKDETKRPIYLQYNWALVNFCINLLYQTTGASFDTSSFSQEVFNTAFTTATSVDETEEKDNE